MNPLLKSGLFLLGFGLAGCSQIAMQAVSVGATVSMDRRTAGAQLEDQAIQLKAAAALAETMGGTGNVYVASYNRQVLLTGEVPNQGSRDLSERVVRRVENVRAVYNELSVVTNATLTQRGEDVYLAARLRAAFFEAPDLSYNAFRVVATGRTVYLMGCVTSRESDRAVQVIRRVNGVSRIVKVLDMISEEELAQLSQKGCPAGR